MSRTDIIIRNSLLVAPGAWHLNTDRDLLISEHDSLLEPVRLRLSLLKYPNSSVFVPRSG